MKASEEDNDDEFWERSKVGSAWDKGCRIDHGQPTWFFSYFGEKQKMDEWMSLQKQRHGRTTGTHG